MLDSVSNRIQHLLASKPVLNVAEGLSGVTRMKNKALTLC